MLGLGLDLGGPWHQRSTQAFLLTSSVNTPLTGARGGGGGGWGSRNPLRLPALAATTKGSHGRSSMARLSISEPSLLTANENILFEGFSSNRHPKVLQKRPPPLAPFSKSSILLPCKTCLPLRTTEPHQPQNHHCNKPAYLHFSKAIQPSSKPRPARRPSHRSAPSTETVQGDLRASVMPHNPLSQGEPLSVVGKPCLLSCSERSTQRTVTGPARTQLHVFLPTEAEGEEVDSESVDEGFMDELDSKITSQKLQQGAPKRVSL
ncbi:uncharacterized protein LOC117828254 [Notolabrus celidotus]|uniref:uncharacterized protein LOC117828254 n=1 Tax=Notolabrus celidotus TaxID=1203425 RepID=UPI00148FC5C4|nr:uncharacterized protein LOC117828254 [Notolabrus celidotus]